MAPPAIAIVGGVVAAISLTVAFHQFIYEPHIAPKLEIIVENWLEKRRARRRLAAAYRQVPNDDRDDHGHHHHNGNDGTPRKPNASPPVEMDSWTSEVDSTAQWKSVKPLTLNDLGDGPSASTLRHRTKSARGSDSEPSILTESNPLISLETLQPQSFANVQHTISRSSTPSTISSSLLTSSPSSPMTTAATVNVQPLTGAFASLRSPVSPGQQQSPLHGNNNIASPRSNYNMADSILSNHPTHERNSMFVAPSYSPPSPSSPFRISPRGLLQVNLEPQSSSDSDSDDGITPHPLRPQALAQARARSSTVNGSSSSAFGVNSSVYESFPSSPAVNPMRGLAPREVFTIQSPMSDSLSIVDHPERPTSSIGDWSDVGTGDSTLGTVVTAREDSFTGSDDESWANARRR